MCSSDLTMNTHVQTIRALTTVSVLLYQDPQSAIPKGTLLAILITGLTYLAVTVSTGELGSNRSTFSALQMDGSSGSPRPPRGYTTGLPHGASSKNRVLIGPPQAPALLGMPPVTITTPW